MQFAHFINWIQINHTLLSLACYEDAWTSAQTNHRKRDEMRSRSSISLSFGVTTKKAKTRRMLLTAVENCMQNSTLLLILLQHCDSVTNHPDVMHLKSPFNLSGLTIVRVVVHSLHQREIFSVFFCCKNNNFYFQRRYKVARRTSSHLYSRAIASAKLWTHLIHTTFLLWHVPGKFSSRITIKQLWAAVELGKFLFLFHLKNVTSSQPNITQNNS